MRKRGLFIVLEGPDKSGKSTQAALLARRLGAGKVVHTREPGGTSFAEAVRRVVLDTRHQVDPLAELLLYEAARAQHTRELIEPALRAGKIVLSERYTLATLAYQGYARKMPLPLVRQLNRIATGGLEPDVTIVLDIPESEFGARGRRRKADRLESEPARFRKRVRDGYRKLAKGQRAVHLLNGRLPVEEVHEKIYALVERRLR